MRFSSCVLVWDAGEGEKMMKMYTNYMYTQNMCVYLRIAPGSELISQPAGSAETIIVHERSRRSLREDTRVTIGDDGGFGPF